jgi:hypothetical protein
MSGCHAVWEYKGSRESLVTLRYGPVSWISRFFAVRVPLDVCV